MTAAIFTLAPAVALGWIIVHVLLPRGESSPGWPQWVLEISLGAGLGGGITSCLFFLVLSAGVSKRWPFLASELICEAALAIGAAFVLIRRRRSGVNESPEPESQLRNPAVQSASLWIWLLRAAAVIALGIFALNCGVQDSANPSGEWDAFTIWNLRARFLAGGAGSWQYAFTETASGAGHPTYPMLTPAFVARTWTIAGNNTQDGALAVDLLFTFATLGLLCGAVGIAVNETAGLLAMLVLLVSQNFVLQAVSQYADIPLAFYVLASIALLAIASTRRWPAPVLFLAGLMAGFAPWTKNEGQPFLLLALGVAIWRAGFGSAKWALLGALPGVAVTAIFKLFFAKGAENLFPSTIAESVSKILEPARWGQILASFAARIGEIGPVWAHPLVLLVILAFTVGFVSNAPPRLWIAVPLAGMLAADFAVYLLTTSDLAWHLSTSNARLITQVWPGILFAFFLMLNPPRWPARAVVPERKHETSGRRKKR